MKKLSHKQRMHLLRRSKNEAIKKPKRKNKIYVVNRYALRRILKKRPEFRAVIAPTNLTLQYEDIFGVLTFIKQIKKYGNQGYFISFHLEFVEVITEGAIAMLLSVIADLEHQGIFFRGKKPINQEARDTLERSGLFNHMRGIVSNKNRISKNKILRTGNKDTDQKILVPEIHQAMETVWGVRARCHGLYEGIGEMMRNSCDHAFESNENIMWHLAISHLESENLVKFSFVDNGKGIISTYTQRDIFAKLSSFFQNKAELLETAFKDGIESRTGLRWRGKGLPTIFEMYSENIVTGLVVITNNVYLDFDKNIFETMKVNFKGTYYFWKINTSCSKHSHFIINSTNNDNY